MTIFRSISRARSRTDTRVTLDGVALAHEVNEAFTVLLEESDDPAISGRVAGAFDNAQARLTAIEGDDRPTALLIAEALGNPGVSGSGPGQQSPNGSVRHPGFVAGGVGERDPATRPSGIRPAAFAVLVACITPMMTQAARFIASASHSVRGLSNRVTGERRQAA
jgi:hypothetical protein